MSLENKILAIENEIKSGKKIAELSSDLQESVETVIQQLDSGLLRVASPENLKWKTHEWIKKAILFYFQLKKLCL